MNAVAKLYNDLFSLEGTLNKGNYPIHKKLSTTKDIYEIVIDQLPLPMEGIILDAGCGVGFGTNIIAMHTSAKVEGITISDKELERAIQSNGHPDTCQFFKMGFEDLPEKKYTAIVCIESLKHALNAELAIAKLYNALIDGGSLIVVEDFYQGIDRSKYANQFMHNWELTYLIDEHTLLEKFKLVNDIDLTSLMRVKGKIHIALKLFMYQLMKETNYTKLFKGGTLLDKLYSEHMMKYKICVYNKKYS